MKCLICQNSAVYGNLCKDCWLGLKCFKRTPKLLARALTYLGPKRTLRTKKQRRQGRKRNAEIAKLIKQQRSDQHDRLIRFERAISK